MRSILVTLLAAALAAPAVAQTKWDLPTGYAPASFQTENVQQFAQEVEQATGGKLKITLHPNGSRCGHGGWRRGRRGHCGGRRH